MYLLPIGLLFHHTIKSPLHILFFILILFGRLGNKIKHILAANIQQESPHIRPSCPISVFTKSKRDSHRTTVSFGEGILLLLWGVRKMSFFPLFYQLFELWYTNQYTNSFSLHQLYKVQSLCYYYTTDAKKAP